MIEKQNTLEWLDFIITIVLESGESEVSTLSTAQYEKITGKIHEKKQNYISFCNRQRLRLSSRRKIQLLIKQHHQSLLLLLDQAAQATARINPLNTLAADALAQLTGCVYELLSFIQSSHRDYLDLDEHAPHTYLAEFTRQHHSRISQAKHQLTSKNADPNLVAILLDSLSIDTSSWLQPVSFRTVFYQRELLYGIEQTLLTVQHPKINDALLELLVYLNFNSRPFLDYYTRYLAGKIDTITQPNEKIRHLLLHYKQFNQMHRKPGIKLSPAHSDIRKFISNWFTQEIGYLKDIPQPDPIPLEHLAAAGPASESFKIMVLLSVDQIGLLLRALDSLRILKARSMSRVFESIVPFLSTPRKAEISWESMRSKSYAFEEKDKQTVIKMLESVINWIKEY